MSYFSYRLAARLRSLFIRPNDDDFDWSIYNIHYRHEIQEISALHTQVLAADDYHFNAGTLSLTKAIKPLHPNHRLLYETVLQLAPDSVCEFGCGGGDHLANFETLAAQIQRYGMDISERQLDYARQRHPDLQATLSAQDISEPLPDTIPLADLAYSQAVIMHIQTADKHCRALENMFQVARSQVVLMENWTRHEYMRDIQQLHEQGRIPWEQLHFHYRESPEMQRPHLMIVSRRPLPQYPVLVDASILGKQAA